MRQTVPGMSELAVEAELEYQSRIRGAKRLAYPPVVAGGARANTLHYVQNDMLLEDGTLVLVDAGAELFNYASGERRFFARAGNHLIDFRLPPLFSLPFLLFPCHLP